MDSLEAVVLDGSKNFTYVSILLSSEEREQIQGMLLKNIDVFAWSHSDMVGIDLILASHKLNISQARKTESEAFPPGSPSDYPNRSRQSSESRFHQRSKVP